MNETDWTVIPAKLKAAGFTVFYNRVSYDPERPLWRAEASRGERQWITMGKDLGAAFVELEKQTEQTAMDWRAMTLLEKSERAGEEIPTANRGYSKN